MRIHAFIAALAATSLHGAAARLRVRQSSLPAAIENENTIALQGVLNNIGPEGSQAPGAFAGVIVASPSTEDPDCEYIFIARELVSRPTYQAMPLQKQKKPGNVCNGLLYLAKSMFDYQPWRLALIVSNTSCFVVSTREITTTADISQTSSRGRETLP